MKNDAGTEHHPDLTVLVVGKLAARPGSSPHVRLTLTTGICIRFPHRPPGFSAKRVATKRSRSILPSTTAFLDALQSPSEAWASP